MCGMCVCIAPMVEDGGEVRNVNVDGEGVSQPLRKAIVRPWKRLRVGSSRICLFAVFVKVVGISSQLLFTAENIAFNQSIIFKYFAQIIHKRLK